MQQQVREMYLKVIDATIESARGEFTENGVSEATVAHLDTLKTRWRDRLLQTQDFTEDPALVRPSAASSQRARAAATTRARGNQVVSVGPGRLPPPTVGAALPLPHGPVPIGGAYAQSTVPPPVKPDVRPDSNKRAAPTTEVAEPATKRVRRAADDDEEDYAAGSDLGSSSGDSDIQSAGSDPEVDNYILAQHDRVRKGAGKWKVQLKEGIAHINGRDYLFNKATCDLDW